MYNLQGIETASKSPKTAVKWPREDVEEGFFLRWKAPAAYSAGCFIIVNLRVLHQVLIIQVNVLNGIALPGNAVHNFLVNLVIQ